MRRWDDVSAPFRGEIKRSIRFYTFIHCKGLDPAVAPYSLETTSLHDGGCSKHMWFEIDD